MIIRNDFNQLLKLKKSPKIRGLFIALNLLFNPAFLQIEFQEYFMGTVGYS